MKPKMMLKMSIDLIMTVLLLCQMAYMLIGEIVHEWIGTGMFVLFILHQILNWNWYKNLIKGKYTGFRVLQIIVNFLVFISMVGLMISGVIMSREVFAFLPIDGGMSFARTLHMLTAYWGFLLMSIHLGLHWGMILGLIRKMVGIRKPSLIRQWFLRALALGCCVMGIYAFQKHNIADYLFVRSQFVFFDVNQPLPMFFCEYLAMMGLWICIAYYGSRFLQKGSSKKNARVES